MKVIMSGFKGIILKAVVSCAVKLCSVILRGMFNTLSKPTYINKVRENNGNTSQYNTTQFNSTTNYFLQNDHEFESAPL